MKIKFGKREQLIAIVVGAIALIGALEVLFFSDHRARYTSALNEKNAAESAYTPLRPPRNRAEITKQAESNEALRTQYDEALTSFGLERHAAFEPIKGSGPDQDLKRAARQEEQVELIFAQIRELMKRDPRRPGNDQRLLFLAMPGDPNAGWEMPLGLPDGLDKETLRAVLEQLNDTVGSRRMVSRDNVELRASLQADYENLLLRLGINNAIYRNLNPVQSVAANGYYVPVINKLAWAAILNDALGDATSVAGAPATKARIMEWLGIRIPFEEIEPRIGNEAYLLYKELEQLNRFLDVVGESKLTQIFGVKILDPSWLRLRPQAKNQKKGGKPAPSSATTTSPLTSAAEPSPTPLPPNVLIVDEKLEVQAGGTGGAAVSVRSANTSTSVRTGIEKPGRDDIGLAFPLVIQAVSTHEELWNFISAVLREFPLAEIDESSIQTAATADLPDGVAAEIKFLMPIIVFRAATN